MFEFKMMSDKTWPWEQGIAPDASNEIADVYVESGYTDYLRIDNDTKKVIPSLKNHCVAVVRWKDTERHEWIIRDDKGVLYHTSNLESLYAQMDFYNLAGRKY